MDEFIAGSHFLNERGNGRPEHPEARRDQHVHRVQFPDFGFSFECEHGDGRNDERAGCVEHHDQTAAVFAVNNYAGEWKQQNRRQSLNDSKRSQCNFRMRRLQNVPGHGGGVHPAADHGDDVGSEYEPQALFLQNRTHNLL